MTQPRPMSRTGQDEPLVDALCSAVLTQHACWVVLAVTGADILAPKLLLLLLVLAVFRSVAGEGRVWQWQEESGWLLG